ncbi:nucleotidyl transferase AbiEii/AbiGii toxin family protein [uncultured Prevotella sp.]|uniref:nucleotidyl transferase AbiEii/AbiGii toxin family protein n=1 Tax=uncultured Prevotella sp. TaxID=159272 RepID=UPI0025927A23|nr:nucleotidyl transferase AbiEii/AbiGii toxin family protein [uncultured Prevotella sp.]
MINRTAIQQWSEHAPWIDNAQIEQDLIICRALVSIFSDEFLASQLAFRGGTALHKLYLLPQPRYSEDIDLVQITPGPIKPIMYRLGEVLDWLPDRVTKQKRYNNTMLFRVESEIPPTVQIRLKVEINCFEHFNVLGLTKIPFKVENSWFTREAELTTYHFEELLGTKLRALYQRKKGRDLFDTQYKMPPLSLYQRKKGRDLFDLYIALQRKDVDVDKVLQCYKKYMEFVVYKAPSYKQFVNNMQEKMSDPEFTNDMQSLLRPGITFNASDAYPLIYETFIDRMEGKRG